MGVQSSLTPFDQWRVQVHLWGWALTGEFDALAATFERRQGEVAGDYHAWWDRSLADLATIRATPPITPRFCLTPAVIAAVRRRAGL